MNELWSFTWEAGPDAGGTALLAHGCHIIGRASGVAAHCDDLDLEPHHVLAEVTSDGVVLRQLTGRVPVRVDGRPLMDTQTIAVTGRVEIANSILTVSRGDLTAAGQRGEAASMVLSPAGSAVVRRPRASPLWAPDPLTPPKHVPDGATPTGGILPAVLALGGSAVIAVLMRQPMFLMFGALGAIVAFGTWGGQRFSIGRRRRRDIRTQIDEVAQFDRAVEDQRAGFIAHHRTNDSTPASARQTIEGRTTDLWAGSFSMRW